MAEEGTAARVVQGTLTNGLGTLAGVAISLVLTPFLIRNLGLEAYGVWTLALTLTFVGGYMALSDLGVEVAAVRYIAEARSSGDTELANRVLSSSFFFFLAVAAILTPILVLAASGLTRLFSIEGELRSDATLTFALIAGQLVFELPARAFVAVLAGAQRFGLYQGIELARVSLQACLFVVVIVTDAGIVGLGAATMASSAVVLVLAAGAALMTDRRLRVSPRNVSRGVLRSLLSFGGELLALRLVGTLYRQMDKLIVGIPLGPRAVTFYEVANKLHMAALMFQSISASALTPATAYVRTRKEILKDMYLRGSAYTVAISLPIAVAGLILTEPIIRTWLGEELTEATTASRIFLAYLTFVVFHIVGTTMCVALGRVRFILYVATANLALNFVISVALVGPLEVNGVVLGTLIAEAIAWPPLLWFFLREFDVSLGEWLRRTVVPNVPGLAAQLATAPLIFYAGQRAGNLAEVGALGLLSVAISLAVFPWVGLRGPDRRLLFATLASAIGRHPVGTPAPATDPPPPDQNPTGRPTSPKR